jgi:hypothetical protein
MDMFTVLSDAARSGRIFRVIFTKKDGTRRQMVCRGGVKRHLKGGVWANGNAGRPSDHRLVVVFDMTKRAYRSIPVDRVITARVAGKEVQNG